MIWRWWIFEVSDISSRRSFNANISSFILQKTVFYYCPISNGGKNCRPSINEHICLKNQKTWIKFLQFYHVLFTSRSIWWYVACQHHVLIKQIYLRGVVLGIDSYMHGNKKNNFAAFLKTKNALLFYFIFLRE